MFRLLCISFLVTAFITGAGAQTITIPGPAGSTQFGDGIIVLANGNYVIRDAYWNNGPTLRVGAVYLYNGRTHQLISRLTGSTAQDQVGTSIVPLANGNFIVSSPFWDGTAVNAGAVTWVNGTTGLSGTVSAANSLTGSSAQDLVGTTFPLTNGNYVVSSPGWDGSAADVGAVTWGNGVTGTTGTVSTANSITGNTAGDFVGQNGIVPLPGGAYLAMSSAWSGTALAAGAVTWASGTAATSGIVSAANSLIGSSQYDRVGSLGATMLNNGNYVVNTPGWNGVGAATWGSGTAGVSGTISSANSLVGNSPATRVGAAVALTNGNYVVSASLNGARAATWASGVTGLTGTVSSTNSLVGSTAPASAGDGIVPLTNGNYVVVSSRWNGTGTDAGSVTWGDGRTGTRGSVSSANSLVGGSAGDQIGVTGVYALANGNYVVASQYCDGVAENTGAVTWGNGSTGTAGVVSIANSLVGSIAQDQIGSAGVTPLSNGNYVVNSPAWDGPAVNSGAVTWANGATGISGFVTVNNSLSGSTAEDRIGEQAVGSGVTALTNGNYVVASSSWQDNAIYVGAVTWGDGSKGITGIVSPANSLTGAVMGEYIGYFPVMALDNGNYVVRSQNWGGVGKSYGAVTWGNGSTGIRGRVDATNSLVGSKAYDMVGYNDAKVYSNGFYAVFNRNWDGSVADAGAISVGTGAGPLTGLVTGCNSILGTVSLGINSPLAVFNPVHEYLLAGMYKENKVVIFTPGTQTLAGATAAATQTIAGRGKVHFLADTCQLINTIFQSGTNPVSGSVDSKVYVESTAPVAGGVRYVRRHYDVQPATNPASGTGTVILYFTQDDFSDYNAANGSAPDLPTDPADASGIAALRISQHGGSSLSGAPGSYTGAVKSINPADSDIIWNSNVSRWEVRVDVAGFGGFFALDAATADVGDIIAGDQVGVSPVPAKDYFVVSTRSSGMTAVLSDMQGKILMRFSIRSGAPVNVGGLAPGIYLLRMSNGSNVKLVKE